MNRARLIERPYAALAYTGAAAILAFGGFLVSLAIGGGMTASPWQIILGCIAVPVLAAAAWSCDNYCESARVRAITGLNVVPLGLINPLAWLAVLVVLLRQPLAAAWEQQTAGD